MCFRNKLISWLLSAALIFSVIVCSSVTSLAVVEIRSGDYSYVKNSDGTYALYCYHGENTSLTLPDEVFGKKVTSIYEGAFDGAALTSVTIPENYKTIGTTAFNGCSALASVELPSSLTVIQDSAFYNCSALETVSVPVSGSLNKIGDKAFASCTALSVFSFPSGLDEIGKRAFEGTVLTTVALPDSLATLGEGAFKLCASLKSLTLPSNLTAVPVDSFMGCSALESVDFPDSVLSIGDRAFKDCTKLSSVDLPYHLSSIGTGAFENDTAMRALFISDDVVKIGADAFLPMSVNNTLTVSCFFGSYTQAYCYQNYVKYNAYDKFLGDVNLDGVRTVLDATIIQKYDVGKTAINSSIALALGDVNGDGKLTVRDATLIQMKIANMNVDFE